MSYMFKGCSELTTIYVGKGWSTTAVKSSDDMFTDCAKLVGGAGTTYNENHVDATYACVDGGSESKTPGYLTAKYGTIGTCDWAIDANGLLTIKPTDGVSGQLPDNITTQAGWPWYNYKDSITKVVVETGVKSGNSLAYMFCSWDLGYTNLAEVDLSGLDFTNTENMSHMFDACNELTKITWPETLNTSNVTNMNFMFYDCYTITSLDLSNFNTSNVTDMKYMFSNCSAITSLDLSNFNTSNVTDMKYMFKDCLALTTIYVGKGWSTDKVTDSTDMFKSCSKLKGGAGTDYDSSHVDKEYARVDGGPESKTPGYLTGMDISKSTVDTIPDQTYTGSAITPTPTVKYGETTLKKDTDYTVSYSNNKDVGTATVTITGINFYSGTKTTTFKINPAIIPGKTGPTFDGVTGKISYTKGNTSNCTITIDRDITPETLEYLQNNSAIYLDGSTTALAKENYKIDSGSTILTLFKDPCLKNLSVGTHTFKIDLKYGEKEQYTYYLKVTIKATPTPYVPVDTSCK